MSGHIWRHRSTAYHQLPTGKGFGPAFRGLSRGRELIFRCVCCKALFIMTDYTRWDPKRDLDMFEVMLSNASTACAKNPIRT